MQTLMGRTATANGSTKTAMLISLLLIGMLWCRARRLLAGLQPDATELFSQIVDDQGI